MKTKIFTILLTLAFLLCGCKKTSVSAPEVTGSFDFTVLKIGQADAIVMQTENHSVMLDTGEKDDGADIVQYLEENGISDLDYVFITHFDKDHVGGFSKIAESIGIGSVIVPDYEGHNSEYKKYLEAVSEKNLTVTALTESISFVLDDVLFEVSPPKKKSYEESDNDFSLVISITHGENSFLFAGDAESERIGEILDEFNREYDFLKVPHHGRYNTSSSALFNALKPAYSVICDSRKNPAEDKTLDALSAAGSEIYYTRDGDISVSSDGRKITVIQ